MAFKPKIKEKDKERDCKDFKPYLFDKRYCKLTFKCANAGVTYCTERFYYPSAYYDSRCTGMEKNEKRINSKKV